MFEQGEQGIKARKASVLVWTRDASSTAPRYAYYFASKNGLVGAAAQGRSVLPLMAGTHLRNPFSSAWLTVVPIALWMDTNGSVRSVSPSANHRFTWVVQHNIVAVRRVGKHNPTPTL